ILVINAMTGIIIGLCLALVILVVATTNLAVGVLATLIIALITCSVLGVINMIGWKLGPLESLNLTLVVGLAVDYVVHLAEGYMELKHETSEAKVKHTLSHVGISVLSGACTTLGASIFLLAAKILFFFQFGIFIFCTIGFSIMYSLFFFPTVMALVGPEGISILSVASYILVCMKGSESRYRICILLKCTDVLTSPEWTTYFRLSATGLGKQL
ncbi:dispatched homolog 3-like, partial [Paramuricea clavata]